MARVFVALRPPREVRAALIAAMGGVSGPRWQDDEQLHLTLRFIGECERHQLADLGDALAQVRAPGFSLSLGGIGTFAKKSRVHTVWIGASPVPELIDLQARVERACQSIGLPPEPRAFVPHVTLARLNAASGPVGGFIAAQASLACGPWPVREFALYQSHLTEAGSVYEELARFALLKA